jgi:hypothetical protein
MFIILKKSEARFAIDADGRRCCSNLTCPSIWLPSTWPQTKGAPLLLEGEKRCPKTWLSTKPNTMLAIPVIQSTLTMYSAAICKNLGGPMQWYFR